MAATTVPASSREAARPHAETRPASGDSPASPNEGNDGARAEVLHLAAGGGLHLAGTMLYQTVLFGILVLVARSLGGREVGLYSQALAFLALLELLSLSGFRDGLTRFVAVHRADDDPAALRGTVRLALGMCLATSVVVGGALYASAGWLAGSLFDDPGLAGPLRFVAATLPPTVFLNAALSATQGFRTMRYRASIGLVAVPLGRLGLTVGLIAAGTGLAGVMAAQFAAHAVGAVLAGLALRRLMGQPSVRPVYRARSLFAFSTISWTASLANTGLIWIDTLLLGIYLTSTEVGEYQMATRLVMFAVIAMVPVNAAFAPQIADLERRGQLASLRRTYGVATSWILRCSLPLFVLLITFPSEALAIFGPGFTAGVAVTVVLVVGKIFDAVTGPCGVMLNQSGRPALNLVNNLGALVLNIGLNLYLIPRHGIVGSAVAWTASLTLVNLARMVEVWITMRMLPVNRGSVKGLAAGVASLAAAWAVQLSVDGMAALYLGLPVSVLVYLCLLFTLGLPAEDRAVLATIRSRVGNRGGVHRPQEVRP